MKLIAATFLSLSMLASASGHAIQTAQNISIAQKGSQPWARPQLPSGTAAWSQSAC